MALPKAGKEGRVKEGGAGGNVVGLITNWTIDRTRDALEATGMKGNVEQSDDNRQYVYGLRGATGTATGRFLASDTGQSAIETEFDNDSATGLTLALSWDGTNGYEGTALITGISVTTPLDDVEETTFSFQFTGAVTIGAIS